MIPGAPRIQLDPQIVLQVLLPPLLYSLTLGASVQLFRATLYSAVLPGVLLTVATMVAVALVARALFPGLPWSSALVLGSVASAVDDGLVKAASQRVAIPRRILDRLSAEALVNATAVFAAFVAVLQVALGQTSSAADTVVSLVVHILGAVLVGAAVGWGVAWLRHRAESASIEVAVSVSAPYAAAFTGGLLGVSPVIAIVAAALAMVLSYVDPRTGAARSSPLARLEGHAFWDVMRFVLSGILFFLIGFALPGVVGALQPWSVPQLVVSTFVIMTVVLALRYMVACLMASLPPRGAATGAGAILREAAAMTWGGQRSVVAVVIALLTPAALPSGEPFPARELVVGMTGLLLLASTALQGFTLAPFLGALGLGDRGAEQAEERAARAATARAGLRYLEEQAPVDARLADLVRELRAQYERRVRQATTAPVVDKGVGRAPGQDAPATARPFARVHAGALDAERRALLALRDRDEIGDELLHRLLHELDVEAEHLRTSLDLLADGPAATLQPASASR
jgi:CPA1 family monovalent cation:H+ antiporter